jgi:hypothetical protein
MDVVAEQAWTDYDHNPPLHMLALLVLPWIFHIVDWPWCAERWVGSPMSS